MPAAEPYPYICVNADGSARELHEETIAWHRAKGLTVIENDDGSYTIMPRPQRDSA
jgi:hypothetical protein